MRATIEKHGACYVTDVFNGEEFHDGRNCLTAQVAFDWLSENYPGIPTEVNIQ